MELLPPGQDAYFGEYLSHLYLRSNILLGNTEKALDMLEAKLARPNYLSPGWLRIDPTFAPLRGHPRFEKLIAAR